MTFVPLYFAKIWRLLAETFVFVFCFMPTDLSDRKKTGPKKMETFLNSKSHFNVRFLHNFMGTI